MCQLDSLNTYMLDTVLSKSETVMKSGGYRWLWTLWCALQCRQMCSVFVSGCHIIHTTHLSALGWRVMAAHYPVGSSTCKAPSEHPILDQGRASLPRGFPHKTSLLVFSYQPQGCLTVCSNKYFSKAWKPQHQQRWHILGSIMVQWTDYLLATKSKNRCILLGGNIVQQCASVDVSGHSMWFVMALC